MLTQELFSNIFDRTSTDIGNREYLETVIKRYPYFPLPHLYLLKQSEHSHPGFEKIAAKTALHINNSFWLNYLLKKQEEITIVETVSPEITEVPAETPQQLEQILKTEIATNIEPVENIVIAANDHTPEPGSDTTTDPAIAPEKEEMLFEPLFASDYFASQGIKLSEEVQTGDKLGKQLKSFTDWLKTMKKVHSNTLPADSEQIDLVVQQHAEKSNQEDEVITESMAEAYLLQGKKKKAVEVYEKLSLLNPSKSAYFAAKIETVKAGN